MYRTVGKVTECPFLSSIKEDGAKRNFSLSHLGGHSLDFSVESTSRNIYMEPKTTLKLCSGKLSAELWQYWNRRLPYTVGDHRRDLIVLCSCHGPIIAIYPKLTDTANSHTKAVMVTVKHSPGVHESKMKSGISKGKTTKKAR